MSNYIYIHPEKDWGLFLGHFADNQQHRHYAVQLSVSLHAPLTLTDSIEKSQTGDYFLIPPLEPHQLSCSEAHLLLLFSPFSPMGHQLSQTPDILNRPASQNAIRHLKEIWEGSTDFPAGSLNEIEKVLEAWKCNCESGHGTDLRMQKALDLLDLNLHRVVSLEEIAGECNLSPSRFLHLFKSTMGITYRRAQLWTRMRHSLPWLAHQSITETAHQFGFADSAHYSRTFRENFGFSPRQLLKNSQFIQV